MYRYSEIFLTIQKAVLLNCLIEWFDINDSVCVFDFLRPVSMVFPIYLPKDSL